MFLALTQKTTDVGECPVQSTVNACAFQIIQHFKIEQEQTYTHSSQFFATLS